MRPIELHFSEAAGATQFSNTGDLDSGFPLPLPNVMLHLNEPVSSTLFSNTGSVAGNFTGVGPYTSGASGYLGNAVNFPGPLSHAYLQGAGGTSSLRPVAFTMMCWVNQSATTTIEGSSIFVKNYFSTDSSGNWNSPFISAAIGTPANSTTPFFKVTVAGSQVALSPGTTMSLSTWHHVALTFDGANIRGYIDGALVGTQASGGPVDWGTDGIFTVGGDFFDNGSGHFETWPGSVDEAMFFPFALTAAQISSYFTIAALVPTAGSAGIADNAVDFIDNTVPRTIWGDPNVYDHLEPSQFSLRAWVFLHSTPTNWAHVIHKRYFSGDTNWSSPYIAVQIQSPQPQPGHIEFYVQNTASQVVHVISGSAISNGAWHHLAMTWDQAPNTVSAYIDGVSIGSASGSANQPIDWGTHGHWQIGASFTTGGGPFETWPGLIDEVYMDNFVMTPAQILAEFQSFSSNGPQVVSAAFIDATHVEVIFNEDVDHTDAITPSNFTFTGGVTAGAAFYTTSNFRTVLTVTGASANTSYTMTVSGVRDFADTHTISAPFNKAAVEFFNANDNLPAVNGTSTVFIQSTLQSFDTSDVPFGPQVPFQIGITKFFIILAGAVDGEHVKIVFNRAPVAVEALNPANYAISHGLGVLGVVQETDVTFTIQTSPQDPGTQYTLTATNIHDLDGDPI